MNLRAAFPCVSSNSNCLPGRTSSLSTSAPPSINSADSKCLPGRESPRIISPADPCITGLLSRGLPQDEWNRVDADVDSKNRYGIHRGNRSGSRMQTFPNSNHLWPRDETAPEIAARSGADNSKQEKQEKLWRDLLADPSQWLDNRPRKCSPSYPDFKHKQSGEALWLDNKRTPAWVSSEIAELYGNEDDKVEKRWREFFADPLKWWDNRYGKRDPNFPDFKHKKTGEVLWVNNQCTPEWVKSEIVFLKGYDHDEKWQNLFSNPAQWWDHRSRKGNPKNPDFVHKETGEGLWLDGKQNIPWIASKVACLGPGTLQVEIISRVRRLSRYNKAGQFLKTVELFDRMQEEGIDSDYEIFLLVIQACAAIGVLKQGRRIHEQVIATGWDSHPYICNSLVDMYAKCGSVEDALNVFNKTLKRDVVSWNALILGFVKCRQELKALELFQEMQQFGIMPDSTTFVAILKACASLSYLEEGRRVHDQVVQSGCESNVYIGSSLLDMYTKCGSLDDAQRVFCKMPTRDVVVWNTMILGFVRCGLCEEALRCFQDMERDGNVPNSTTFVAVLNACANLANLEEGKAVHDQIIRSGFESDASLCRSLIDMYAKCGVIEEAQAVFDRMSTRDVVSWTAMMIGFVKCGQGQSALKFYRQMQKEGVEPDSTTFVAMLGACASVASLEEGRRMHEDIVRSSFESDPYVGSSLIDMYAECGSIKDAEAVFDKMASRNVVAWTGMIVGFVKCGHGRTALKVYRQMQKAGVDPNDTTLIALLKACASLAALEEGRAVHNQVVQSGYESNLHVGTSLVDMYLKCGSSEDALRVFQKMSTRDVVAWNAMILGLVKCGQCLEVLELYQQMQRDEIRPDSTTFVALVNACASLSALEEGRRIHNLAVLSGFESDAYIASSLIDMYAKCGSIEDAQVVFNKMPKRNVVSWTAMMFGFVKCGQGLAAVKLYRQMRLDGVEPDSITFVALLNACASAGALEEGREFHKQIIQSGWEYNALVGSSLVDMYAKCGSIEDAQAVFNKLPTRDVVSWTAMMFGFVRCGQDQNALELYEQMQKDQVKPDSTTFVALLNACAHMAALEEGRLIHRDVVRSGCESNEYVGSSLVDMYAKCGSIEDAQTVFDKMSTHNVVAWTAMIIGFVKRGEGLAALELYEEMQRDEVEPDSATYAALLNACASIQALEIGRHIHKQVIQSGCQSNAYVSNSLVDMYAKCGNIEEAQAVFDSMSTRDVISWTAMINGFVKCGKGLAALELYQQMQEDRVMPNSSTFVALLNACASMAALEAGRSVHKQVAQSGFESNSYVSSALVGMYAKCGTIVDAKKVFDKISTPDVISSNAMIQGFAMHGLGKDAVAVFEQMSQSSCEVNEVTFVGLLSACSHGGLVKKGLEYFGQMQSVYGVSAIQEHYTCIVDILGRAGHLEDAEAMIKTIPFEPTPAVWLSLLGSCRNHGKVDMGEWAAQQILKLDPEHAAGYVLLANIYSGAGHFDVQKVT